MRTAIALALTAALVGCATPGAEDEVSQATMIAMSTGPAFADIVEHLPPEAWEKENHNRFDMKWYDRQRSLFVNSDDVGHQVDFASAASGESAVRDNQTRATVGNNVIDTVGVIAEALAAAYAGRVPAPPPVVEEPVVEDE